MLAVAPARHLVAAFTREAVFFVPPRLFSYRFVRDRMSAPFFAGLAGGVSRPPRALFPFSI